jgi:antitoxin HicB
VHYRVFIQQDEDGMFVAEVPSLPGCVSQGKTRAEALRNAKEAIEGYLDSLKAHGDPVPPPVSEEIIEVDSSH